MSPDRKKIQKIFNQIDRLAVKGKEQIFEYHKLIDDLISKGDYNYFELTLFYSYNININDYLNLTDIKNKTWEEILFQTNSSISKKIKKVLDTKGVYQVGFNFFKESNNVNIGKILEIDQLSDDSKYYLLNKQYARLIGLRITYLEVTKFDDYTTNSVIINTENYCTTENCLVNRYKIAVDYLLTPLWIESALESLNSKYAEITSLVPNLYRFWDYYSTDDDDNTILTGIVGGTYSASMYDGANYMNTNRTADWNDIKESGSDDDGPLAKGSIPYTHTQAESDDDPNQYFNPPMDGIVKDGTNYFGEGSKYFTNMYPGLFIMIASGISISEFNISGNVGSDGDGVGAGHIELLPEWTLFYKTNTDNSDDDPSINKLILVHGTSIGIKQEGDISYEYDDHRITGIGDRQRIIYAVTARNPEEGVLTEEDAIAVANKILEIIGSTDGSW